jgi:hypothetical protein
MTYFFLMNNIKSKKGTVILLALFVLFFTATIISLIFSFNSRIIQLAKEERKNYKSIYYSTKEVDSNIYLVKLLNYGFLFENWTWKFNEILNVNPPLTFSSLDNVKRILFHQTENNIRNNLKNNLVGKFDITDVKLLKPNDTSLSGVECTHLVRDYVNGSYEGYNYDVLREVFFKGRVRFTIKTKKDNENYIYNEIEYPLSVRIKYLIKDYSPDYFNVKIFVEPEDL